MPPYDPTQVSPLQKRIAQHRADSLGEAWDEPSGYSTYDKWNDETSWLVGGSIVAGIFGFQRYYCIPGSCLIEMLFGWFR